MGSKKTSLYRYFINIKSFKWETAVKSLLAGAAGGILAVMYRLICEKTLNLSAHVYGYIKSNPLYIILWAAAAVLAGLIIYLLIKLEPMASGGGVPQVEGVILYGLKMKWYLVIAIRYAAGFIGSLFGMSFGPEGPSIQLGAAASQGISDGICRTKTERDHLVTSGAAAGLSAAFGAPLTGMIFALEEIHRNFSPSILLSATMASLTADFTAKFFFGLNPVFSFPELTPLPLKMYFLLLPLGIFAGLFGALMNRGLLLSQTIYGKLPEKIRPVVGILTCLPFAVLLPDVLGGGHDLIYIFKKPEFTLLMAFILLLAKLLFTCTCFGSGTPGGIFMPIISVGALSGCVFGLCAVRLGVASCYLPAFIICAMAGGLSACVKSPVTCIILTAELTGSFATILPVAVCTLVSLFISDLLKTSPVYEALLKRYMAKHMTSLELDGGAAGELFEIPVECGSEISGNMLKDVAWPKESLIIGLRRGSEELIPKGSTVIMPGDYLLAITPRQQENIIRESIEKLCKKSQ